MLAIEGDDEWIEAQPRIPPPYPDNRFLKVSSSPKQFTAFNWKNFPLHRVWPSSGHLFLPRAPDYPLKSPLSALKEEPHIVLDGLAKSMPHFQRWGHCAIVTGLVMDCVLKLDPEGLESREVKVEGAPAGDRFFLILPKRYIDAVDTDRSKMTYKTETIVVDGERRVSPTASPSTAYCLRADLPSDAHWILNAIVGDHLWSRELVDAVIAAGARFISFGQTHTPGLNLNID